MRKNTARKWVHLLLDLLPVLIIPIFAIYIINHEPQGIVIERQEKVELDFNQLFSTYSYSNNGQYGQVSVTKTDYNINLNGTATSNNSGYVIGRIPNRTGHKFCVRCPNTISISNNINWNSQYGSYIINNTANRLDFTLFIHNGDTYDDLNFTPQIFDLTQMYGVGNEPTLEVFNSQIPYTIEPYTLSEPFYIDVGVVQYNSTDVGSQFIYSLYKPVNDYFNMTNLFNFGDIYTWINNSMFSGNAPLPIFIVYNVIVYEFLIDLIFLIYSIFMFIIDFSSDLLARCFSFSNKGGTR